MIIMGQWTRVENNNEVFLRVTNHTGQAEKNLINEVFLSDEGPMLETLDYTIRIGSIPTFLYLEKNLLGAAGIRTRDLRFTSPMLYQLSYRSSWELVVKW